MTWSYDYGILISKMFVVNVAKRHFFKNRARTDGFLSVTRKPFSLHRCAVVRAPAARNNKTAVLTANNDIMLLIMMLKRHFILENILSTVSGAIVSVDSTQREDYHVR